MSKDQIVFLPRIQMQPTDTDYPFILKRLQFPVINAFAITINKSQGQSFEKVGIYLTAEVFTHGQLYVAFSRATSKKGVIVHLNEPLYLGRNKYTSCTIRIIYLCLLSFREIIKIMYLHDYKL